MAKNLAQFRVRDAFAGSPQMGDDRHPRFDVLMLLGVEAKRDVRTLFDLSGIHVIDAGDGSEQSGFAGTVEAQDEKRLAALHDEVDVFENGPIFETLGETLDPQHNVSGAHRGRKAHLDLAPLHGQRLRTTLAGHDLNALGQCRPLLGVGGVGFAKVVLGAFQPSHFLAEVG